MSRRSPPTPYHDLQALRRPRRAAFDEPSEGRSLPGIADGGERAHAEDRIADPTVPVVPVPAPARTLGQGGRRGGDHGPGRRIRQRLERERGPERGRPVGTGEASPRRPAVPPVERLLEAAIEFLGVRRRRRIRVELRGLDIDQRRAEALSGVDRHTGTQVVPVGEHKVGLAEDEQGIVAADGAVEPGAFAADPRLERPVIEPGNNPQREVDAPAHPRDHAQHLPIGRLPPGTAHGEAVEEADLAVRRAEGGLQHQRAVEIAPRAAGPPVVCRPDRAVAALLPVQQTTEAATGVEARQATPVDRAGARHQRRCVTVADQRVGIDRRVALLIAHRSPRLLAEHHRGTQPRSIARSG